MRSETSAASTTVLLLLLLLPLHGHKETMKTSLVQPIIPSVCSQVSCCPNTVQYSAGHRRCCTSFTVQTWSKRSLPFRAVSLAHPGFVETIPVHHCLSFLPSYRLLLLPPDDTYNYTSISSLPSFIDTPKLPARLVAS
ncbi:hypothetical protein BCV70DRAFT_31316 [Testicularia cyperi]|uniref:Hydrophobin n=1 Tax=Testicularia cyperi TaxID=1882483 RepID=A0A317XM62_9BASI|nr:hypothetical protein BCV70DRAFT_31316 [Testicularia cyperi]